jgi:uncharacterized protein
MPSLVPISPDDCLRHLEAGHLGRLAFVRADGPAVLPINYAWDGVGVVFRTTIGSKLDAATAGALAAFEIDDADPLYHVGWSVVVRGPLETLEESQVRRDTLRLTPWWAGARDRWLRLRGDEVTGRRLVP